MEQEDGESMSHTLLSRGAGRHRSPGRLHPRGGLRRAVAALWRRDAEGLARLLTGDGGLQVLETRSEGPLYARVIGRDGPQLVHVVLDEGEDPGGLALRVLAEATRLLQLGFEGGVCSVVLVLAPAPPLPSVCVLRSGPLDRGHYRYDVVRLDHFPASELAVHPVLAPLAPLGARIRAQDIRTANDTVRTDPNGLADRLTVLYVAAGVSCPAAARRVIRLEELMESETFLEIMRLGFDQGWDEGEERSRAYVRDLLLRQWNLRFPGRAGELDDRLAHADFPALDQLGLALAGAAEPDQVGAALRR